jgi:hypothetical protein
MKNKWNRTAKSWGEGSQLNLPNVQFPSFEEWLVHSRRRRLAESREEDELTLLAMADADRVRVIHRARNVWKIAFGFIRLSTKRRIDTGVKRAKALPA